MHIDRCKLLTKCLPVYKGIKAAMSVEEVAAVLSGNISKQLKI